MEKIWPLIVIVVALLVGLPGLGLVVGSVLVLFQTMFVNGNVGLGMFLLPFCGIFILIGVLLIRHALKISKEVHD